jgi:hypothetical protein
MKDAFIELLSSLNPDSIMVNFKKTMYKYSSETVENRK